MCHLFLAKVLWGSIDLSYCEAKILWLSLWIIKVIYKFFNGWNANRFNPENFRSVPPFYIFYSILFSQVYLHIKQSWLEVKRTLVPTMRLSFLFFHSFWSIQVNHTKYLNPILLWKGNSLHEYMVKVYESHYLGLWSLDHWHHHESLNQELIYSHCRVYWSSCYLKINLFLKSWCQSSNYHWNSPCYNFS